MSFKSWKCERPSAAAFTLVELLTVIFIIGLLASILMPTIGSILGAARAAESTARIQALAGAIMSFHRDHHYYPGQRGSNPYGSRSEWLARAMFTDEDATPPSFPASSKYMSFKEGWLYDTDVLSDGFPREMAICYYPARLGGSGLGQYVYADNDVFTNPAPTDGNEAEFHNFIEDTRFGETGAPYNPGEFLLIAPGKDREYFTSDDPKNW
ncbi:MAG: prepilin-type N-terminal cleavage/methylation domain-containing protein [Phycisphaerae bacterium]|nr:prepilin-type N-terminal cleavage/methylation domain-containing protein [Phycisphaerae bacterium]